MDVPGATSCPACGGGLNSTPQDQERPIQTVEQGCSLCSWTGHIGLCWYPGGTYEVVAPVPGVFRFPCSDCPELASIIVVGLDEIPTFYCDDCCPAHLHRTYAETSDCPPE